MQRGKGMKFVGDSRVKANNKMPNVPKDTRNIQVKQKHSGQTSY